MQALALAMLFGGANAHPGCGGQPLRRQAAPTGLDTSLDPNYECQSYNYPPLTALAPNYPGSWDTAYLLQNDTTGWSIFNALNASVNSQFPNIAPRGTPTGNFKGVDYPASDPDCWWTYSNCVTPAPSTGLQDDITIVPEPETYGLTFDDGPLCSHNLFYDFLMENQQKATLFYIGSNIYDSPVQGLRGFQDGHQICVHTWSHQYMTSLSNEVVFAELYYTRRLIKDLFGVTPQCWRPPYGDVDNRVRAFAKGLNLTTIVWANDTSDWTLDGNNVTPETWQTVDDNYEYIINGTKNGMWEQYGPVVLAHELSNNTMTEAMTYYPQVKAAFKHVVPIAAAYNQTQPYVEDTVLYPNFEQYTAGNINQTVCNGSCTSTTTSATAGPTGASGASSGSSGSTTSASGTTVPSGALNASPKPTSGGLAIRPAGWAVVVGLSMALLRAL